MCKWTSGSKGEVREKESLVVGDGVRGRRGQGKGLDPRIQHGDMALSFFFNCMFYQLLNVEHSCSSTQSWGSILPYIVETRDQNSQCCPLLFSNRNLGSFCV